MEADNYADEEEEEKEVVSGGSLDSRVVSVCFTCLYFEDHACTLGIYECNEKKIR